ncbi:hypothetical protein AB833_18695 [Chromatiales bacterium (ex Bugula neritina AB1)]|nr:hypothetical protein AB833_18695 [Chromatiales bacterium (ex Bugula neritina AB1)]
MAASCYLSMAFSGREQMNKYYALVFAVLAMLVSPYSISDQKNDDLPALFGQLKAADSPQQAIMIETEIWKKWYERSDAEGGDYMASAVDAMSSGRYTIALNLLNNLVKKQPDFAEAWNRRATVHYLLGDYEQSLADIEQTLILEPRHFGAISGIGLIMLQVGDNERAIHAFERVLQISPKNMGAAKSIKDLEQKLGVTI